MKNIFDKETHSNNYEGYGYIISVLSGEQVANKFIISLCEKIVSDFSDDRFYFDTDWSEQFMKMFQNFEHVIAADSWKSRNILLEPWQKFLFMCIEGFYWKDSKKRKYKTLYCEVARGNGKSAMLSVVGLIYLSLYRSVSGNKILALAAKKEQARIVLDSSREMAKKNKSYRDYTGVDVYAHHIAHEESGSEFKAISSDSKTGDGLQPLLAIVDELHAHRSRALFDVIDSAMSKRPDSLMAIITTSGFSLDGIGYSQSCYAKEVALKKINDETFFPFVFTLDEDDDWRDEKNWVKSNPNMGVSVDADSFRSKALKAQANPSDESNFKVKHLNIWQNSASQFFNVKEWDFMANKDLCMDEFLGHECYVGIDLASTQDLTSFVYVFKKENMFYVFAENFAPELTIQESKNVNYTKWKTEGKLIETPGKTINYDFIEKRFIANSKKFKIKEAFFDSWNAREFAQKMSAQRIEMVEFRMTTANLSEPMKKLNANIIERRIIHDGSELMSWCLGNVVAKLDHNDNVFPRKDHESMKIDPIVSMIMAFAGYVRDESDESIYKERGMVFI